MTSVTLIDETQMGLTLHLQLVWSYVSEMTCHGELEVSFEESQSHFVAFGHLATKGAFHRFTKFLIVLLIKLLLKPSFLKQHKSDLEQYPLAPTTTVKRSTHQLVVSMIVFKANYLLILVRCQDFMFSLRGHFNLIGIIFLKLLDKIIISGLVE